MQHVLPVYRGSLLLKTHAPGWPTHLACPSITVLHCVQLRATCSTCSLPPARRAQGVVRQPPTQRRAASWTTLHTAVTAVKQSLCHMSQPESSSIQPK